METEFRGRVLLVEPLPAKTDSRALGRAGFEALSVSNGPEAIALAAKEPFDVFVVDVDLPSCDWRALIRRLREDGSTASVVCLAADNGNDLAVSGAEAGVLQILKKPADAKTLTRMVAVAVDQSRRLLTALRTVVSPVEAARTVAATDAKNEFGSVLETAVHDGAVVITKHDSPKAILISVERVSALLARHEPSLKALTHEFDELVARMQRPEARAATRALFSSGPKEFGEAALKAATIRRG